MSRKQIIVFIGNSNYNSFGWSVYHYKLGDFSMILWYACYFCITLIFIIIYNALGFPFLQSYVYAVFSMMGIYIIHSIINSMISKHILDEECDPVKYLSRIQKHKAKLKRNKKLQALLSINEAVGYILLGDYHTAKGILESIDKSYLSDKNGTLFVYTIDYIVCCFELGELEEALHLMETQLLVLAPINKGHKMSVQILIGERDYFLGKYEESYRHLINLLDVELNRRQQVSILYRLALIDMIRGNHELANKRFQKIAQYGNKLWIADKAREYLNTLIDINVNNS